VKGDITGFEIAGEDGIFYPAEASLGGRKALIHSEKVPQPKAVRYQWVNYGEVTVFGKNGIPAAPFCFTI
jgi:sialate O-acetylesterase